MYVNDTLLEMTSALPDIATTLTYLRSAVLPPIDSCGINTGCNTVRTGLRQICGYFHPHTACFAHPQPKASPRYTATAAARSLLLTSVTLS